MKLGRFWAYSGRFWADLGRFWADLGEVRGPSEVIFSDFSDFSKSTGNDLKRFQKIQNGPEWPRIVSEDVKEAGTAPKGSPEVVFGSSDPPYVLARLRGVQKGRFYHKKNYNSLYTRRAASGLHGMVGPLGSVLVSKSQAERPP